MTDAAGTQTYGYDELDRLTQVTRGTATFAYEYDRFDNVTKRTYPAQAAIDYRYDAADNLHEAERASKITTYDYTAADQLETTTYPSSNGHIETRTWDRAGRLEQIRSVKGNDVLADYQYSLDENGNPFHVEGPYGEVNYTDDDRDRLTEACYAPTCEQTEATLTSATSMTLSETATAKLGRATQLPTPTTMTTDCRPGHRATARPAEPPRGRQRPAHPRLIEPVHLRPRRPNDHHDPQRRVGEQFHLRRRR